MIKRLELELGGNTPFVALADADVARAVDAAIFGKFLHQGQICMAVNRFIVDDAVYDSSASSIACGALKCGDPDAADTVIGPLINEAQLKKTQQRIREVNDTEYGLSGAVFTRDLERGRRFALRLQSGMAHVNDQPVNDLHFNPFGGEKNSGIGRFNGAWAIEAFTTDQWVSLQHEPPRFPF